MAKGNPLIGREVELDGKKYTVVARVENGNVLLYENGLPYDPKKPRTLTVPERRISAT